MKKSRTITLGLPIALASMDRTALRDLLVKELHKEREFIELYTGLKFNYALRMPIEQADEIAAQATVYGMTIIDYTAALLHEGV